MNNHQVVSGVAVTRNPTVMLIGDSVALDSQNPLDTLMTMGVLMVLPAAAHGDAAVHTIFFVTATPLGIVRIAGNPGHGAVNIAEMLTGRIMALST